MKFPSIFKAAAMSATAAAAATLALTAQADSFTSSASSAGSASSGSVSTSLNGSSNSSSGDNKTAGGPYHIIQMAAAPKANTTRLTMQHDASKQLLVLDLPAAVAAKEGLELGGVVLTQPRSYGFEFAHADTQKAFFLVLEDDWHSELAARPVNL
jgi:hypothetical protein